MFELTFRSGSANGKRIYADVNSWPGAHAFAEKWLTVNDLGKFYRLTTVREARTAHEEGLSHDELDLDLLRRADIPVGPVLTREQQAVADLLAKYPYLRVAQLQDFPRGHSWVNLCGYDGKGEDGVRDVLTIFFNPKRVELNGIRYRRHLGKWEPSEDFSGFWWECNRDWHVYLSYRD